MIPLLFLAFPPLGPVPPADDSFPDGPYCGVYCVYAAARMHGREVAFESLLRQEFIGSYKGSTVEQLRGAAASAGLTATAFDGLTVASLRASTRPILLHVRRPGYQMPYAHWVLYAGTDDGFARVVDPPGGVERIAFAELAAYWDGIGVVISDGPLAAGELRSAAWIESAGLFAATALLLSAFRRIRVRAGWRRFLAASAAVLVAGGGVGLLSHCVRDDGFYRNPAAAGLVKGQHFEPRIAELNLEEMKGFAASSNVTIVDARVRVDYEYGHLPGAVNLPVTAGLAERRTLASALPAGWLVIVYCQSSGCKWADSVAADLFNRGFTDIAIFRGGWREWDDHE